MSSSHILIKIPSYSYDEWLQKVINEDVMHLDGVVPRDLIDEKMCWHFLRPGGYRIQKIPVDIITEEIAWFALMRNSWVFPYLPKKFITYKMCLYIAQHASGMMFRHVPTKYLKIPKLTRIAIGYNLKDSYAIDYMDRKYRPKKCWELALKNGYVLNNVEKDALTPNLCLIAVQKSGPALRFVPEEYVSREMCWIAYKQNPESMRYIPGQAHEYIVDQMLQERKCKRLGGLVQETPEVLEQFTFGAAAEPKKCKLICLDGVYFLPDTLAIVHA